MIRDNGLTIRQRMQRGWGDGSEAWQDHVKLNAGKVKRVAERWATTVLGKDCYWPIACERRLGLKAEELATLYLPSHF